MKYLLLVLAIMQVSFCCVLCPFRTPPRPRPVDQYRLPTMAGVSLDKMPKFCNATKQLPVDEKCREQFERIFCSADLLVDSFSGCGVAGTSSAETCSKCAHQKADNLWVLKWFDSVGKPAAGISDGNYYWLGDYEICSSMRSSSTFEGQYCRVEIEVPDALVEAGCPQTDPLSIVVGVCFPSVCSVDQLAKVSSLYLPYNVKVECESESSWSSVTYIILAIVILWLIAQAVASTQPSDVDSTLSCFSVVDNARRALSTRRERDQLHAVHGIEFVVVCCIVTGNVYNMMLPYIENVAFSFEGVSSIAMHIVNNYSYQIDGLLALSAFYTTYLLYGGISSIKDALHYVAIRFFRFWPAYVFCVIFMYVVFPGLSSGPMWIHTDTVERCQNSWWKNILFINNFYDVQDTCVDFGYVISLEAQFYVLLVFCIYLSRSHVNYAKNIAYASLLVSIGFSTFRAYSYSLPPAPMLTVEPVSIEKTARLYDSLLLSFICRLSAYCIGFVFGIGCATAEDRLRQRGLTYKPHVLLAILCVSSASFAAFGAFSFASRAASNRIFLAFYAAFHRPCWSFAVVSFIYLCHHNVFVWLNAILGWRVFAPLSKLSWLALVVSEPIILYFFSSLNKPAYATHWSTMYTAVSTMVLSYLIALCLDIFIARPIRYLIYREQKHNYADAHAQH